jgi:hypothetical protein
LYSCVLFSLWRVEDNFWKNRCQVGEYVSNHTNNCNDNDSGRKRVSNPSHDLHEACQNGRLDDVKKILTLLSEDRTPINSIVTDV